MANLSEEGEEWPEGIYQIEPADEVTGGAGGIANLQAQQLAIRTRLLSEMVEYLAFGLARTGQVLIQNRGIVEGCAITKSLTATRNLTIAEGVVFAFGREWAVPELENAASVPENTSGNIAVAFVSLVVGALGPDLVVTPLSEPTPDSSILLAQLQIPDGSTDGSDPNLDTVDIALTARVEPAWPIVQVSPGGVNIFMDEVTADYLASVDVLSWDGHEVPAVVAPLSARTDSVFRLEVLGGADNVLVRWALTPMVDAP